MALGGIVWLRLFEVGLMRLYIARGANLCNRYGEVAQQTRGYVFFLFTR